MDGHQSKGSSRCQKQWDGHFQDSRATQGERRAGLYTRRMRVEKARLQKYDIQARLRIYPVLRPTLLSDDATKVPLIRFFVYESQNLPMGRALEEVSLPLVRTLREFTPWWWLRIVFLLYRASQLQESCSDRCTKDNQPLIRQISRLPSRGQNYMSWSIDNHMTSVWIPATGLSRSSLPASSDPGRGYGATPLQFKYDL